MVSGSERCARCAVRFKLRAKDALSVAVFRKNVVVLWVANSAGPKATSEGSSRLVISSGGNNARAFKEAIIQGVLSVSAETITTIIRLPLWFSFDVCAVKATLTVLA